jgi:UDP-galactopyranose mutase
VVPDCPGGVQPNTVVNYPSGSAPHTRVVEYKHLFGQQSARSVLVREYPSAEGPAFYPVPSPRNQQLYAAFQRLAEQETGAQGETTILHCH